MHQEITCKNCGEQFAGKFCNRCGEKIYHEHDKSVGHLFHEAFHFITHFEGTFFNPLKAIFTKPGKLSLDYCNGLRKRYFKPISFFLLLVILYLLFPVFEGLNMKLYYHVRHDFYGEYAMQKALEVMKAKNLTDPQMGELFHLKSEKTSKFLLFIIIPVMALISKLLGFKNRRLYFDHFIFSIEVSSFFILWGFLLFPFLISVIKPLRHVIAGETQTGIGIFTIFIIYLTLAAKRFFGFKWWYTLLYSLVFSLALILFLEFIYKFILFFIAIHLV
jgi:hypothetical protein